MGKFIFKKRLDLAKYNEGAYLEFKLLTYKEISKISKLNVTSETKDPEEINKSVELTINLLADNFLEGKLPDEKGVLTAVDKEDLSELPIEILTEAIGFLSGAQTQG